MQAQSGVSARLYLLLRHGDGGDAEVALTGGVGFVRAFVQGSTDFVFIGSIKNILTHSIITGSELKRPEDLKGKRIGVTRIGSNSHYFTIQVVRRVGLDPLRDVTFIQTGGAAENLAALLNGSIDRQAHKLAQWLECIRRYRMNLSKVSAPRAVFFAIAFLAAAVVFVGPKPSMAATMTVKAGYPQPSGAQIPLWVAAEARTDRRYGFDLQVIYISGGARLTQTVVSGDIEMAMTGGAVVNGILSGAELVYIAIGVPTYGFSVYVRPEIKDVSDLKGKILGVMSKGASSDHAATALLRQKGIRPGQDVKFLYLGGVQQVLAALDKGVIPAGVISSPTTLQARRLGYRELVNIASLKLPYIHNGIVTRRALVRQNPELIKSFLKAYVAAIKITLDEPELAKRALARFLATNDAAILDEAYQAFRPLFPKVPYMNEDFIRSVLSVSDHPKASTADPKDFFDNRFLKELEDSGFIQEIYGKGETGPGSHK